MPSIRSRRDAESSRSTPGRSPPRPNVGRLGRVVPVLPGLRVSFSRRASSTSAASDRPVSSASFLAFEPLNERQRVKIRQIEIVILTVFQQQIKELRLAFRLVLYQVFVLALDYD